MMRRRWLESCVVVGALLCAILFAAAGDAYAAKKRITVNEKMISLPDLLRKIADQAGSQLVMTPGVDQMVPVANFRNRPWDEAMRDIVTNAGFNIWIEGDCAVVSRDSLGLQTSRLALIPEVSPDKKITLNYENAALPIVLDRISSEVGISILMVPGRGEDLIASKLPGRRTLSINLRNIHWRKALELVAASAGCSVEAVADGVYVVRSLSVVLKAANRPIQDILRDISEQSGINVVISPKVKGNVTVNLDGVPWAEALDAIVTSLGLSWTRHSENTILITGETRDLKMVFSFLKVNYLSGRVVRDVLAGLIGRSEASEMMGSDNQEPPFVLMLNLEPHHLRTMQQYISEHDRPAVASAPLEFDLSRIQIRIRTPEGVLSYSSSLPDTMKMLFYREFQGVVFAVLTEHGRTSFMPIVDKVMIEDTPENLTYVEQMVLKKFPPLERDKPGRELVGKEYGVNIASSDDMARVLRARMGPYLTVEALDGAVHIRATLRQHKRVQEILKSYDAEVVRMEYNVLYGQIDSLAALLKSRLSPLAAIEIDPLTRIIIVEAPVPDQRYTEKFLRVQDAPDDDAISVKVFKLNFAKAEELSATLEKFLKSTAALFERVQADSYDDADQALTGMAESMGAGTGSSGDGAKSLSGRIDAVVLADVNSNSLIVTAKGRDMPKIQNLIDKLDREPKQVLILGRIIETTVFNLTDIGLDVRIAGGISGATLPTTIPFEKRQMRLYDEIIPDKNPTDIGTGSSDIFPPGRLFGYADPKSFQSFGVLSFGQLSATLELLDSAMDTKLISSPRIVILDNHTAKFVVSESQEYRKRGKVTEGEGGQVAFEYEYAIAEDKISIEVTPQITPNGKILMTLKPEVNTLVGFDEIENPDGTKDKLPIEVKRMTETKVIVDDGMTLVLAGLVRNWVGSQRNQIPFLGSIPILGRLFRKELNEVQKRNLLFFFTPIIMKSGGTYDAGIAEIRSAYTKLANTEKKDLIDWDRGKSRTSSRRTKSDGGSRTWRGKERRSGRR